MNDSLAGLFITGTNTGVGKTHVTACIAEELRCDGVRVGLYKPACSGSEKTADGGEVWNDVERLAAALGHEFPRDWICPQRFSAALAPPSAAKLESRCVDDDLLRSGIERWRGHVDVVLVEGVGGWLCPLSDRKLIADLAADFAFPVLIVSAIELGTINHTLLTVESVRQRNLPVAGIVMNCLHPTTDADLERESLAEIQARCSVPIRTTFDFGGGCRLPGESTTGRIDWLALVTTGSQSGRAIQSETEVRHTDNPQSG